MKTKIFFKPIGFIRSEHKHPDKTPIQPVFAKGCLGRAEIFPEYEKGLKDVEGFSHLCLIYHFHKNRSKKMIVRPFLENNKHGIFATRSPARPNAIGFSVVRLIRREGPVLHLEDVDMLDGTPILDIKPFIRRFDFRENTTDGWQENMTDREAALRSRRNKRKSRSGKGSER